MNETAAPPPRENPREEASRSLAPVIRYQAKRRIRVALFVTLGVTAVLGIGTSIWALNRFVIDHVVISDVRAYEASASASASATPTPSASSTASAAASPSSTPAATGTSNPSPTSTPSATSKPSAKPTAKPSKTKKPTAKPTATPTRTASASPTATATPTQSSTPVVTANSYTSDAVQLKITQVKTGSGQDVLSYFVADITLSDPLALRSAFANNEFGTNIIDVTSDIARQSKAIFAFNGDYYGFRDDGILIRNGVKYRDNGARVGMALMRNGGVRVYDERTTSAQSLLDAGAWNTMSFGPAILINGKVQSGIDNVQIDTNIGAKPISGRQPRTAIGLVSSGHYIVVVVDGRQPGYSLGATLTELAQIMRKLGCTSAYNLDGGGSAEMWFNGSVVNRPSTGSERGTSDIFYIGG